MISKIKIPNLWETVRLTGNTAARFPLAILSGFVGTMALCYLIGINEQASIEQLTKLILICALGISFFTTLQLISEHLKTNWLQWGIQIFGFVLLIAYYFSLPVRLEVLQVVRYILFFIVAHLMVSFAPFINKFDAPGFWAYNKELFLQTLTAFFFSAVLFAGLALALAGIENLFDFDIEEEMYGRLFFVIFGLFSMLYFLGGVPESTEIFTKDINYSKGLSILTQYILIPLVGIYTLILYLYTCKIIIAWEWPRGWIAYLFVSYAVLGILAYLLMYPLADNKKRTWIRTFDRCFFISLIPLIVVLFLAIYRRVEEYGLTENRYFLFLLDFWLLGIAIYFIFSKARNIKLIPITLAVIVLLSSFGPWGAFSWSVNNQINRFDQIMDKGLAGMQNLSFKDRKNLSSILTYLEKRDGLPELQSYFSHDIDSLLNEKNVHVAGVLLKEYDLEYINNWETKDDETNNSFFFNATNSHHANIAHNEFVRYEVYGENSPPLSAIKVDVKSEDLLVVLRDTTGWSGSVNLKPLVDKLLSLEKSYVYDMDAEQMALVGKNETIDYKIYVQSLRLFKEENNKFLIKNIEFELFFTRKK